MGAAAKTLLFNVNYRLFKGRTGYFNAISVFSVKASKELN